MLSEIARSSVSHPFQCRFMSRMAQRTSATTVLELGTSLGISGSYLSAGVPAGKIVTIEGDPAIAAIAEKVFMDLEIKNIELYQLRFEDFIKTSLHKIPTVDLLFIDGNHRREALMQYFMAIKPYFHPRTIVIVDDIYWSPEMQEGWSELVMQEEVTQSVDCFHFGLLFFDPGFLDKENHLISLPYKFS